MQEQKQQVKEAVTNVAKEKGKEALQEVLKESPAKDIVNNILGGGAKKDSTQTQDTTKTVDPVKDLLQNKLQNLLKKKKN
jgi:hypothetical protein